MILLRLDAIMILIVQMDIIVSMESADLVAMMIVTVQTDTTV
jgi:hypothetical protein